MEIVAKAHAAKLVKILVAVLVPAAVVIAVLVDV